MATDFSKIILAYYQAMPKLEESELADLPGWIEHSDHGTIWWYQCPRGGDDHCAFRPVERDGLFGTPSRFLTCVICDQQWYIRPVDVASIIETEERKYMDLLIKSDAICKKVFRRMGKTPEAFAFLKDTYGIDREIAEAVQE